MSVRKQLFNPFPASHKKGHKWSDIPPATTSGQITCVMLISCSYQAVPGVRGVGFRLPRAQTAGTKGKSPSALRGSGEPSETQRWHETMGHLSSDSPRKCNTSATHCNAQELETARQMQPPSWSSLPNPSQRTQMPNMDSAGLYGERHPTSVQRAKAPGPAGAVPMPRA